ncbi:carboxylate--amine ligase, partial [bacterium]|nr:carboxylate--amine ligase [bacterium]
MIRPSTQKTGSSAATSELPPAVLVGFDSMQGLPAARVLARHGVPVIGIAAHPNNSQAKTNVCREIRFTSTDEPSLIDHLVELGQTLPVKSVLFPCA